MRLNVGWVERLVRFLIGLPTATAYFYVRHFDMNWAYAFLVAGLALLVAGFLGHDPMARSPHAEPATKSMAPSFAQYAHTS